MLIAEIIYRRIQQRYADASIRQGGIFQVENGLVDETCQQVAKLLESSGIVAVVQWGSGFLIPGVRVRDFGYEAVQSAFNLDKRLSNGGVALVGMRDEEFGQAAVQRIEGIVRVGSSQRPKRMMSVIVGSHCAQVLGPVVEDMRRELR